MTRLTELLREAADEGPVGFDVDDVRARVAIRRRRRRAVGAAGVVVAVLGFAVAVLVAGGDGDRDRDRLDVVDAPPAEPDGELEPIGPVSLDPRESPRFSAPDGAGPGRGWPLDVRVAEHDGFVRVAFELGFDGSGEPPWRVSYVEPPVTGASGIPVVVDGGALLEVRFRGVSADPRREDTPADAFTQDRIPAAGGTVLREVVLSEDFELDMAWLLGLDREQPFAAGWLEDPPRLVVDILDG